MGGEAVGKRVCFWRGGNLSSFASHAWCFGLRLRCQLFPVHSLGSSPSTGWTKPCGEPHGEQHRGTGIASGFSRSLCLVLAGLPDSPNTTKKPLCSMGFGPRWFQPQHWHELCMHSGWVAETECSSWLRCWVENSEKEGGGRRSRSFTWLCRSQKVASLWRFQWVAFVGCRHW